MLTLSQNRDTKRCGTKTHCANRCVGSESRTLGILDIPVPLDITVVFLEITNSLANSASNIKKVLKLRRRFPDFCAIFKSIRSHKDPERFLHEIMPGEKIEEKQEVGWDFVCKQFMDENPGEFKKMIAVEIQLLPFEWLVFDSDLIHWGGPYPQSGYLNIRLGFHYLSYFLFFTSNLL